MLLHLLRRDRFAHTRSTHRRRKMLKASIAKCRSDGYHHCPTGSTALNNRRPLMSIARRLYAFTVVTSLMLLLNPLSVPAQDKSPEAEQQAMMKAMQPGPQHKQLAKL